MSINQEFAKVVDKNKDISVAFDGKSLALAATVDEDSFYPRNETGHFFNPDQVQDFIKQFNHTVFTQFKDQASSILRVGFYNPKELNITTFTL